MTRNDTFFKILFAIEIALLPLVMAAEMMMPAWSMGLFVAGILVARIWMEIFKNKQDRVHILINSIGSILTISSLAIFFDVKGYIGTVLTVFIVIFIVLMNIFRVFLFGKPMPEMVDAVDACFMMFECLALVGFAVVVLYALVLDIALFALLLTAIVSVAYKVFYIFKTYNVIGLIKDIFAKLFRRR